MTVKGIPYRFRAKPWQHPGPGGWYFVSLPTQLSTEIRRAHQSEEGGWGRLKTTAWIGSSEWDTAIWFDTKHQAYLLPLKAIIRKKENIGTDRMVDVVIRV